MEALASICSDTQSPVVQGSKSVASMEDYKPFSCQGFVTLGDLSEI